MAEVYHNTQAVHLADDLTTESTNTIVRLTATGRVADVVVAIVAQRHIDNAALGKMLEVFYLAVQSQSVFNA